MEEQDRIETEDTDVEGHKLSQRLHEPGDEEGKGRRESEEGDDPDVEGHKFSHKVSHKLDP